MLNYNPEIRPDYEEIIQWLTQFSEEILTVQFHNFQKLQVSDENFRNNTNNPSSSQAINKKLNIQNKIEKNNKLIWTVYNCLTSDLNLVLFYKKIEENLKKAWLYYHFPNNPNLYDKLMFFPMKMQIIELKILRK